MLLIYRQSVEPTLVTTNVEIMWFAQEMALRDEILARITSFNPTMGHRVQLDAKIKWEVEAPDDPCDRLHLIAERVPHSAPWPGTVSRCMDMREVVPPKQDASCVGTGNALKIAK
jgi:hypothetical protein